MSTAPQKSSAVLSFHFRLYVFEQIIIEEINDRDPQAVAQLLERGNGGAVVAAADHIVHGGLRNAAIVLSLLIVKSRSAHNCNIRSLTASPIVMVSPLASRIAKAT